MARDDRPEFLFLGGVCDCCESAPVEPVCPFVLTEIKDGSNADEDLDAAKSATESQIASASWGSGPVGSFISYTFVEEGSPFNSYSVGRCDYRFRLIGGNTGYARIDWVIKDQDDTEITAGSEEHEWDVNTPLDETIGESSMSWPPVPPANQTSSYTLTFTVACTRVPD